MYKRVVIGIGQKIVYSTEKCYVEDLVTDERTYIDADEAWDIQQGNMMVASTIEKDEDNTKNCEYFYLKT